MEESSVWRPYLSTFLGLMFAQGGVPVNARSCKHLISILGEEYEAARLKLKNPHGRPLKGSKPAPKAKASSKRKKAVEEDEDVNERSRKKAKQPSSGKDDLDEVDEQDDEPPAKAKIVPKLLLAVKWDSVDGIDPTGWWISEKLDGVRYVRDLGSLFSHNADLWNSNLRTYFDGKRMISRLGNPFAPPKWFLESMNPHIAVLPSLTFSRATQGRHPGWRAFRWERTIPIDRLYRQDYQLPSLAGNDLPGLPCPSRLITFHYS
jgi:hypothetical protein